MKKAVLISLVVLFVMGLAVSSDAMVRKKGMGMGMRHGTAACDGICGCDASPMEMLRTLGLDEKQMEAVQAVHLRTRKDMIRKRADVQVAEIELRELLLKDPVDLKAAEAAVKKIEGLRSEMEMIHIKAKEEIKANLTPEQKKKFLSMTCMGPMGQGKGIKRRCNMQDMDSMDEMAPMGPCPNTGDTPPMRHRNN